MEGEEASDGSRSSSSTRDGGDGSGSSGGGVDGEKLVEDEVLVESPGREETAALDK